ncbi:MAG: potassium channel family protein, partial [Casimicrobium sp.]
DAQPKAFSSIPAAMWWAVMTLTTVGYGDVYPITPLGKFFAAVIATGGIAVFALPMAIITAAILDVKVEEEKRKPERDEP